MKNKKFLALTALFALLATGCASGGQLQGRMTSDVGTDQYIDSPCQGITNGEAPMYEAGSPNGEFDTFNDFFNAMSSIVINGEGNRRCEYEFRFYSERGSEHLICSISEISVYQDSDFPSIECDKQIAGGHVFIIHGQDNATQELITSPFETLADGKVHMSTGRYPESDMNLKVFRVNPDTSYQ